MVRLGGFTAQDELLKKNIEKLKGLETEFKDLYNKHAPTIIGTVAVREFKKNFQDGGFFGERWKEVKRRTDPKNFSTVTRGKNKGEVKANAWARQWRQRHCRQHLHRRKCSITLPTPDRKGYTFGGWYASSDLTTGGTVTTIAASSTGNKEFWAKWTATTYTITYHANGGSGATDSIYTIYTIYTIESADIYLPTPSKGGDPF